MEDNNEGNGRRCALIGYLIINIALYIAIFIYLLKGNLAMAVILFAAVVFMAPAFLLMVAIDVMMDHKKLKKKEEQQ